MLLPLLCLLPILSPRAEPGSSPSPLDQRVEWKGYQVLESLVPCLELRQTRGWPSPLVVDQDRFLEELTRRLPLPEETSLLLAQPMLATYSGEPVATLRLVHPRVPGQVATLFLPLGLEYLRIEALTFADPDVFPDRRTLPPRLFGPCLRKILASLESLDLKGQHVHGGTLRYSEGTLAVNYQVRLVDLPRAATSHPGAVLAPAGPEDDNVSYTLSTDWHLEDLRAARRSSERFGLDLAHQQELCLQRIAWLDSLPGHALSLLHGDGETTPLHYSFAGHLLYLELGGQPDQGLILRCGDVHLTQSEFRQVLLLAERACAGGSWLADLSLFPAHPEDPRAWQRALVVVAKGPGAPGETRVLEWVKNVPIDDAKQHDPVRTRVGRSRAVLHEPWTIELTPERVLQVTVDSGKTILCNHGMPGPEPPSLAGQVGESMILRW